MSAPWTGLVHECLIRLVCCNLLYHRMFLYPEARREMTGIENRGLRQGPIVLVNVSVATNHNAQGISQLLFEAPQMLQFIVTVSGPARSRSPPQSVQKQSVPTRAMTRRQEFLCETQSEQYSQRTFFREQPSTSHAVRVEAGTAQNLPEPKIGAH